MQVSVDFGKLGIRYFLIALVIFLSIISSFGENSHATEINMLPRNRTEIDNIKNISLEYENNRFVAKFRCDYIFDISLSQHFELIRLDIEMAGLVFVIQTNESNKLSMDKQVTWYYDCPIKGNATVKLVRSKTVLIEKNFTNLMPTKENNATIHCSGLTEETRQCEIYRTCFTDNIIYYPSTHKARFPNPLIRFSKSQVMSAKKISAEENEEILSKNEIRSGLSLIVNIGFFDPLSWNWIKNVGAPLAELIKHSKDIVKVLGIGTPRSIVDSNLVAMFADVLPVTNDYNCVESSLIRHLRPSDAALNTLRDIILKEIPFDPYDSRIPKAIVLKGGPNSVDFTNIEEIASQISHEKITIVDLESTTDFALAKIVANAKYVFSSSGIHTSQAFWIKNGTFVEFSPEGYECMENGSAAARASNSTYYRYVVKQNGTFKAESDYPCVNSKIVEAPEQKYRISKFEFK
ncbi:hypothetical protein TVAG_271720 [Trichomonas vaginalis G3]|uniref:Uncharacterized protein n=1 Tax=Trichomonas vaginalis (strain ATCC PRA-98 / G3) TaxID=412133 RepID=A2E5R9_TRIV3|nr:protein of unknown function, DUF563 family [Trichomonas vaginalis G3]EAY11989.1 hypothetical protein TVAG_271720 [Trichomonas vaginalis G3]KAI5524836.1 protein of unknown function, DUF563 family [Trichomonas vaginalis G3]|eukprot:XP_001324212.1 hypothetical protein [Trichomonas vaginalis G3]